MAQPDGIRQSDLLNQLVLDRTTLEELGRVELLWMYPTQHRVLGFICKSGLLSAKKLAFNLPQIKTLGENGILVQSNPVETDAEKVKQLESLLNCEVWSDDGHKVGKIVDYYFNLKTGAITTYLLLINGITGVTGSLYLLPPSSILNFGRSRVLVSQAKLKSLEVYQESLKQKIGKVGEVVKEEYTELTQGLRSLTEKAKHTGEETRDRVRSWSEQLKDRAQQVRHRAQDWVEQTVEQSKEQAQTLNERLRDSAEEVAKQTQTESQEISQTVQQQGKTWAKRVRQEGRNFWEQLRDYGEVLLDAEEDDRTLTVEARRVNDSRSDFPDNFDPLDDEDWGEDWEEDDEWDIESPPPASLPKATPTDPVQASSVVPPTVKANTPPPPTPPTSPESKSDLDDEDWLGDDSDSVAASPTAPATPAAATSSETVQGRSLDWDEEDDDPWI